MGDLVPRPGDRALTLWQPWATLIALRVKRIETRGWSTRYRGPLWIHAAARRPDLDDMLVVASNPDAWHAWHAAGLVADDGQVDPGPLGAIVARVNLVDVVPVEDLYWYGNTRELTGVPWVQVPAEGLDPSYVEVDAGERPYGDYTAGRYGWLLDDIEPLAEPVPARGRQQLWRIPEAVDAHA